VRSALASIRAHRLRSFLTSLGIVIGVASVITVISLIQGLSKSVSDQFEGLGGNGLTIQPHNEFKDVMRGKINYLRFEDVEQLRARVDEHPRSQPLVQARLFRSALHRHVGHRAGDGDDSQLPGSEPALTPAWDASSAIPTMPARAAWP
jgi:ABC-type lipoprotein release transport system permease subunit